MQYISIFKKIIEDYEMKTGTVTEICAAFNLSYLWRESKDIDEIAETFCKFDFDIITPILRDERSEDEESKHDNDTQIITATADDLIRNAKRKSKDNLGICIPGYCLMFRSWIVRKPKEKCTYRAGKFCIEGQEKLLKVDSSEEYRELQNRINLNSV